MERFLWNKQYVQYDLIRLQRKYKNLGYHLSLEDCYDVWIKYSESEFANWLETSDEIINNSLNYVKDFIKNK